MHAYTHMHTYALSTEEALSQVQSRRKAMAVLTHGSANTWLWERRSREAISRGDLVRRSREAIPVVGEVGEIGEIGEEPLHANEIPSTRR